MPEGEAGFKPEAKKPLRPAEKAKLVVDTLAGRVDGAKRIIVRGSAVGILMFTAACGHVSPPGEPGLVTRASSAVAETMRAASPYVEAVGPSIDKKLEEASQSPQAQEAAKKAEQASSVVKQGADQARRAAIEVLGGTPK